MIDFLELNSRFMGAVTPYEQADAVLVGIPMDFTVSFRPGSRSGPQYIRQVSYGLEEYSIYLDRSLEEILLCDAGDIQLPIGNVEQSLERIEQVAKNIIRDGKRGLFLGGEHLVSYPLIKAHAEHYDNLAVIHFDAHADLRIDYLGEKQSHATVMRKAVDILGGKNIYQFGIRSGTADELAFGRANTQIYPDEIFPALESSVEALADRNVYVTLDIDVVDPAYAPGTGTPEPGGCNSKEIIRAIHALQKLKVVGFDLVEVAPASDLSDRTALLAGKIIREFLLTCYNKRFDSH